VARIINKGHYRARSSRISLNTMCLAQVGFVDTIDFGELDGFFFERGGCLLIVWGQRLAVPAPSAWVAEYERLASIQHDETSKITHHGAKNSMRIRFSASMTDLKLAGVKSMTSDAPSATTNAASKREDAEAKSDGIRILIKTETDEVKRKAGELGELI
jgi:hypothetical protein